MGVLISFHVKMASNKTTLVYKKERARTSGFLMPLTLAGFLRGASLNKGQQKVRKEPPSAISLAA